MKPETRLIQYDPCPGDVNRPTSTPLYQTATFAQPDALHPGGYDYSRSGNPTRAVLEAQLAGLEGADRGFAFSSGMAAINAVLRLVPAGGGVVLGADLYGGTWRLLHRILSRYHLDLRVVDLNDEPALAQALSGAVLCLVETPTNPLLEVVDLRAVARACRKNGVTLAVDNSLMSPLLQRPLDLGAHVVIHSATKFLGGHADLTAGAVMTSEPSLIAELALFQNGEGTALAPFECWLLLRGLKTLAVRLSAQRRNTHQLVEAIVQHDGVKALHWPGLANHPGAAIHADQALDAPTVFSFRPGSVDVAAEIVDRTRCFTTAVSFGSVSSTIELPCVLSHASIPDGERTLPPDLIRVSVGIEAAADLVADLVGALDAATGGRRTNRPRLPDDAHCARETPASGSGPGRPKTRSPRLGLAGRGTG